MLSELIESELLVQGWRLIMNEDTTNSATNNELENENEEMLEEYNFSSAKRVDIEDGLRAHLFEFWRTELNRRLYPSRFLNQNPDGDRTLTPGD
jgi:hypothetical protein